MKFKTKYDKTLVHITLRVPASEWSQLKLISQENNWVLSDVARHSFSDGIKKFLKEYQTENKPVQREMF